MTLPLYRAVDKTDSTVDFLLTAKRDTDAALRFLRQAIEHNGLPEKVTIDCSRSNAAGIAADDVEAGASIEASQRKCLKISSSRTIAS